MGDSHLHIIGDSMVKAATMTQGLLQAITAALEGGVGNKPNQVSPFHLAVALQVASAATFDHNA